MIDVQVRFPSAGGARVKVNNGEAEAVLVVPVVKHPVKFAMELVRALDRLAAAPEGQSPAR